MPSAHSMQPTSLDQRANGIRFRILAWRGDAGCLPFLLLHGLASNARFWEPVGSRLARAGHPVFAADLRGHGQSEAPAHGYDFETVTQDVAELVTALGLAKVIVVGHSWGGLVALDLAAHLDLAALGLVDGGFTQLSDAPGATWEKVEQALAPPRLAGTPLAAFRGRIDGAHPDWPADVPWQEIILANFDLRPDGTISPHLTFENHMRVVRAMWDFPTYERFDRARCPVLMVAARRAGALARRDEAFLDLKRRGEAEARARIADVSFVWMEDTDHDVPLHRPDELAALLSALAERAALRR